ncbi:hypothetical protein GBAR_LOCUS792 [Geodia barretti]|uniref:Fibronectin type-III domain-containing protein n=1 Tax=Geodia barretti TaxID=519541 RepID=A0AA35QTN7_GEOBA|nr:hypothetical protein GBAR_LOCUS792 [Geodia barretti]
MELSIIARAEYNGTIVECFAASVFTDPIFYETKIATLNIQGILLAVSNNMEVTYGATSVIISWTPPFSLDVTDVDPDIWYSVLIYNVTDENNPTALLCTDCINITETNCTFTPDYLSPCHVYLFSVIPFNGAGQGESSHKCHCQEMWKQICRYILHGVNGLDNEAVHFNLSNLGVERLLVYTLPENEYFSVFFEVFTTAGAMNTSFNNFSTYDVQSLSMEEERGGGVLVRGEFVSGSRAAGCLVVLQGPPTFPDIFRALLRTHSQDNVSTTVPVPPSTYTVYGYDVEENDLPYTVPAVVLENQTIMESGMDVMRSPNTSQILKSGNISRNGSTVVIDCQFSEVSPQTASCVLVYREYGTALLTVVDMPHLLHFPVSLAVHSPENYTFALFGKHPVTGMEEQPLLTFKLSDVTDKEEETVNGDRNDDKEDTVNNERNDEKEETVTGKSNVENSKTEVVVISTGTAVVGCVLGCGSAVLVMVVVKHLHRRSKSRNATNTGTAHQMRTMPVYDEVVLPPTTSSSVIPTEPNTAYVTTTMSRNITTDHNVAYAAPL